MFDTICLTQYICYNKFDIKVRQENLTQWVQNNMCESLTAYLKLLKYGYKPNRVYSPDMAKVMPAGHMWPFRSFFAARQPFCHL